MGIIPLMPLPKRQYPIAAQESCQRESEPAQNSVPARVPTGFVLLDSTLRVIQCNSVALEIFGYPDMTQADETLNSFISGKIAPLVRDREPGQLSFVTEFFSGRRQYFCRAYLLGQIQPGSAEEHIAVVLERSASILSGLKHVANQFELSPRESQVLRLILRGFSNKEIANEMKLSPNTVKAFTRMVMIKMAAPTRARVVSKTLNCLETLHELELAGQMPGELSFVDARRAVSTVPRASSSSASAGIGARPTPVRNGGHLAAPLEFRKLEIARAPAREKNPSCDAAEPCPLVAPAVPDGFEYHWRDRFTPKEIKILALLVQGSTCEQIATQLDAPEKTIKNYLRALVTTTGSSDLSELAEFAIVQRVLDPYAKEY